MYDHYQGNVVNRFRDSYLTYYHYHQAALGAWHRGKVGQAAMVGQALTLPNLVAKKAQKGLI